MKVIQEKERESQPINTMFKFGVRRHAEARSHKSRRTGLGVPVLTQKRNAVH